jgi:hypothetical protein
MSSSIRKGVGKPKQRGTKQPTHNRTTDYLPVPHIIRAQPLRHLHCLQTANWATDKKLASGMFTATDQVKNLQAGFKLQLSNSTSRLLT